MAYCGYDNLAAGMLKENLGVISEESMELVLQTAARSLHTKGILIHLKEEEAESAFVEGFKDLLDDMANSSYFLRCYNETEYGQFVLTSHSGRNGFVYHLVSNEIVHILRYSNMDNLLDEITGFFNPVFHKDPVDLEFVLPENRFQQFIASLQNIDQKDHFLVPAWAVGEHEIGTFIEDYFENNGNIVNMSLFFTKENELPAFSEVFLILVSDERVWVMKNINKDKGQEPIIKIQAVSEFEWKQMISDLLAPLKEH